MNLIDFFQRNLLIFFGKFLPTDIFAQKFPVSVKGVILFENKVILLKNERGEWDLPGGKIKIGEDTFKCLEREIKEELNLKVEIRTHLSSWVYHVMGKVEVFIISHNCVLLDDISNIKISKEHFEYQLFSTEEINDINIYDGYKVVIKKAMALHI